MILCGNICKKSWFFGHFFRDFSWFFRDFFEIFSEKVVIFCTFLQNCVRANSHLKNVFFPRKIPEKSRNFPTNFFRKKWKILNLKKLSLRREKYGLIREKSRKKGRKIPHFSRNFPRKFPPENAGVPVLTLRIFPRKPPRVHPPESEKNIFFREKITIFSNFWKFGGPEKPYFSVWDRP